MLLSEPVRRGSRWSTWLALLALLVALRLALPVAFAPVLEESLSRVLDARVEIGDLSFAPLDAVVTLRDVRVHAPSSAGAPALVAARVRLDVQWLPLVNRTLVVRELALESAHVDLARLVRQEGSLERLVHVDPAAELPPGWSFALEGVALRDTRLRLPELGGRHELEVAVREARLATRQRSASAFKRSPNLRVDALVDGGRIRIDGSSDLESGGVAVDALVRLKDVPLDRLHAHLPDLGWTAVRGLVSGQLHYQREPERRDLLSGRVRVRRVAVHVPALDGPALAIRRAEADVDAIDLRHRRVSLASLTLHGARLAVRADLAAPLPLLDGASDAGGATVAADAPAWTWSIGHAAVPYARLLVAGADGEIVLRASAAGESLGPGAYWAPLRGWVARGDGVAVFDGTARMTRGLTIDGRLTAHDVDAATFARAFGMPHAELVQAGRGSADLNVELDPGAKGEPALDVRGKVTVHEPWLAAPEADAFATGARAVYLTVGGLGRGATGGSRRERPTDVRISDATVVAPYLLVTRAENGWLLPPFPAPSAEAPPIGSGAIAPVAAAVAPEPVASPAAPEPVSGPAPEPAPPRVVLRVASVRSEGGRVLLVDRATTPTLVLDLDVVEGWAEDVRAPEGSVGAFVLQVAGRDLGTLQLASAVSDGRRELELSAQSLPLAATAPWLERAGLPYWFAGGTGSVVARVAFSGGRWAADTTLALRAPYVGGDRAALGRSLGMPVEAALDALRDADGDMTLRLPLAAPRGEHAAALDAMVATALREAIVRARQAPLPAAPLEIAFSPGRSEVDAGAARQIATLADVLAARPDAVVELASRISSADRRWLAEQAAVAYLEEPDGLMGVLHALGVRDQHARIREALAERAAGYPGRLDRDDEAALRELAAAAPPVDEHRLAGLAAERVARVARVLSERHGIAPARVVTATPARDGTAGPARDGTAGPTRDEPAAPPAVQARLDVDVRRLPTASRPEAERW